MPMSSRGQQHAPGNYRGPVFWALAVAATALLWVSPADVRPLYYGAIGALEPGRQITRWAAHRAYRLYKAGRELPSQTLSQQPSPTRR
jgi:hypothetical protein